MSSIIVPACCFAAVATGALIPLATTGNLFPDIPVSAGAEEAPDPFEVILAQAQTPAPGPWTPHVQESAEPTIPIPRPLAAMPVITAQNAAIALLDTQDSPTHHPDAIPLEVNGQQFHVGPAPLLTTQSD